MIGPLVDLLATLRAINYTNNTTQHFGIVSHLCVDELLTTYLKKGTWIHGSVQDSPFSSLMHLFTLFIFWLKWFLSNNTVRYYLYTITRTMRTLNMVTRYSRLIHLQLRLGMHDSTIYWEKCTCKKIARHKKQAKTVVFL